MEKSGPAWKKSGHFLGKSGIDVEAQLGIAESMASTPSKNEFAVSRSFQDDDEIALKAAAKMTRFAGKGTLKIKK